jgi:hypothetical protein
MSDPNRHYDDLDDLEPSRRPRRAALIVVAVCCVIAAGVAVGLLVNRPGSADEGSGLEIAESPATPPSIGLPAGCELLTPGQVAALVPGTPTKVGRGPGQVLDSSESACSWSTLDAPAPTDPATPRVPPAALDVKATAAPDEKSARDTMQISLPCKGSHSERTEVSGADEACLDHTASRGHAAVVSARFDTLVIEVSYQRASWPGWRVDDQSEATAAALIGRVVQSH